MPWSRKNAEAWLLEGGVVSGVLAWHASPPAPPDSASKSVPKHIKDEVSKSRAGRKVKAVATASNVPRKATEKAKKA